MREIEKVKEMLGIGFGGSVVTAVEAQKKVIDDLKTALGLPPGGQSPRTAGKDFHHQGRA